MKGRARGGAEGGAEGAAEGGVEDGAEGGVMNSISADSTLSPLPQNLIDLWQEYIEGIGGRKPARIFSFSEWG